ncbi:hypothetical protein TNCV_942281 [Trichonephila clavipes]|nr:hypothetical protein TNCV_942281 [Trichonephila clavipes]
MEGRRFASEVSDISHWRIGKISDLGVTQQPGRALLTFFYFTRRGTKNPDGTETPYGERLPLPNVQEPELNAEPIFRQKNASIFMKTCNVVIQIS